MEVTYQVAIFILFTSLVIAIASFYIPEKVTVYNTVITQEEGRTWRLATEGVEEDV